MRIEEVLLEFGIRSEKKLEHFLVKCPFHDDQNPSGQIHIKTGQYVCWVCKKNTTFLSYLMRYSNLPYYQVKQKLGGQSDVREPHDNAYVEALHDQIWKYPSFLNELYKRKITDEIIRRHKLGVIAYGNEKRISIPIPNEVGEWANIRGYIPGAAERKFTNSRGRDKSKIRFYPYDQLEFDTILVCGGEIKALAAADVLNKYDIGAISPTCGENDWPNELNHLLDGKLVYVNCDIDETGRKYSTYRCRTIKAFARAVHEVIFTPEQVNNEPKGDINDFLAAGGDLFQLLKDTPEWVYVPGGETLDEIAKNVSFREGYSSQNIGKRVTFPAMLSGISSDSYSIASHVNVVCPRDKEYCMICDVNSKAFAEGGTEMIIGPEHPAILALIGSDEQQHSTIYKRAFKIPKQCKVCAFNPVKHYDVLEARLDEPFDPTSRNDPLTMKTGFVVNGPESLDAESYNVTGRLHPSPKNAIASFLISHCEPTRDALDFYTSPDSNYFKDFEPAEWTLEALEAKLDQIYSDLEANITKIYRRRDYHIGVDLTYHSVLQFDFAQMKNVNAYLEFLAVGDTEQGKSKVVKSLRDHYGLGVVIDAGSTTKAGLTIGLEGRQGKHFSVYGALPKNDRRLVIIEELIKMKEDVFSSLTEVRSSGKIIITKIGHKSRNARVRLIALSNPPRLREVASYTFGIEASLSVIGTLEDLRRFDLVYILGKDDVERPIPELENPPKVSHVFDDELCQRLVLKAWKCERVEFEDCAYIMQVTKSLLEKFGDGLPILGQNSSHIKVAKLSAAVAARTHSYEIKGSPEKEVLIVRKCHVDFIEKYLNRIYSSKSCGLDQKAKAARAQSQLKDKEALIEFLKQVPNCDDVMRKICEEDTLSQTFIRDIVGEFHGSMLLFSRLIQCNAIYRVKNDRYGKNPEFTALLKNTEWKTKVPDYLQDVVKENQTKVETIDVKPLNKFN